MKETKRERFIRVAEQRTQKVLDALSSLSNCAARESYEYSDSDVEQIIAAIEQELQSVRNKFAGVKKFSLSSARSEDTQEKTVQKNDPTFVLCLADSKDEFDNSTPSESYELNTLDDCIRECTWLRAGKIARGEPDYFAAYVVAEDGSNPWHQIFDPLYQDASEHIGSKTPLEDQILSATGRTVGSCTGMDGNENETEPERVP